MNIVILWELNGIKSTEKQYIITVYQIDTNSISVQVWSLIHLMPQYMAQTARDLKAKRVLTVHHSKYALAKHRWDEPLKNAEEMKNKDSLNVLIPEIGEVVALEK